MKPSRTFGKQQRNDKCVANINLCKKVENMAALSAKKTLLFVLGLLLFVVKTGKFIAASAFVS